MDKNREGNVKHPLPFFKVEWMCQADRNGLDNELNYEFPTSLYVVSNPIAIHSEVYA